MFDKRLKLFLLVLSIESTCGEGNMYLFEEKSSVNNGMNWLIRLQKNKSSHEKSQKKKKNRSKGYYDLIYITFTLYLFLWC